MPYERARTILVRAAIALAAGFVVAASGSWAAATPATGAGAGATTARAAAAPSLGTAQDRLNALLAEMASVAAVRDRLQGQLATLLGEVDSARREIEGARARLLRIEVRERELRVEVDAQRRRLDRWAAEAYMNPGGSLEVILGSSSFDDLQRRLSFLDMVSQSNRTVLDGLRSRAAAAGRVRETLDALKRQLQRSYSRVEARAATLGSKLAEQRDALARLDRDAARARALVRRIRDRLARERAWQDIQRTGGGPPPVPPPPPGSMSVQDLIRRDFGPLGSVEVTRAMCVAYHESRYLPGAINPSSGAAGVFQFMPQVWPPISQSAGWAGSSALDPVANVAVAAWTVGHVGWSPWRGDAWVCGLPV
jgi:peptidoglycan hydrolase CwlO-like protein